MGVSPSEGAAVWETGAGLLWASWVLFLGLLRLVPREGRRSERRARVDGPLFGTLNNKVPRNGNPVRVVRRFVRFGRGFGKSPGRRIRGVLRSKGVSRRRLGRIRRVTKRFRRVLGKVG